LNSPAQPRKRSPWRLVVLIGALLMVATVGVAAVLVLNTTAGEGDSLLERWVRGQIIAIANDNLHPQLAFETFDLQLPDTVTLSNIELVATEPGLPTGSVTIFAADELKIVLAERPKRGRPLVIERLVLTDPTLRLVATEPGGAAFAGFSNLVKQKGEPKDDGGSTRLSDIFQLRLIKLTNAMVVYDPRLDDIEAMTLPNINTELKMEDPEAGWHAMELSLDQSPVIELNLGGRMHLDEGKLDIAAMRLVADLSRENDARLPPQVQQYLRQHDIRGRLDVTGSGLLAVTEPAGSTFDLNVNLTDGFASFGEYVIPIQSLELPVALKQQTLTADLLVEALGGRTDLDLTMNTTGAMAGDAKLNIAGVRIQDVLAARSDGKPPKYAGTLDASVHLFGPFAEITTQADGQGQINVIDGRLVNVPLVSGLISASKSVLTLGRSTGMTDTADATFTFEGDRATFSDVNLKSSAIAARGKGDLYLDGRLAMRFNGGPIEGVQGLLGAAGELLGKVTDQLMTYTVKGTVAEPRVGVQVISALGSKAPDKMPEPTPKDEVREIGERLEQLNPLQ